MLPSAVLDAPTYRPYRDGALGTPQFARGLRVMRWMESLVERTGAGGLPTIQRLWALDRQDRSSIRLGDRDYLLRRGFAGGLVAQVVRESLRLASEDE